MLVDVSGDNPRRGLPAPVRQALSDTAAARGSVTLLALDGAGRAPQVLLSAAALDDATAGPSRAVRVRQIAVACVERAALAAAPAAAGSDELTGLQVAAQATAAGGRLLVVGNGLSNTGVLDLRRLPVAAVPAGRVVSAVPAGEVPAFGGKQVTFYGLGASIGVPASQTVTGWLADLYSGLCRRAGAAGCTADTAVGDPPAGEVPHPAVPGDPQVALPAAGTVLLPSGATRTTLPAALLFASGSAQLGPQADTVLADLAGQLAPGSHRQARVDGYTDSDCPPDVGGVGYCVHLAAQRAQAVADRMRSLGADPVALTVSPGRGPADPVTADRDAAGRLDPVAAAANRRVTVTISPN